MRRLYEMLEDKLEKIDKAFQEACKKRFELLKNMKDEPQDPAWLLRLGGIYLNKINNHKLYVIKVPGYLDQPFIFLKDENGKYYLW